VTRAPFLVAEALGPRAARVGLVLFLASFVVAWSSPHPGSVRGFTERLPFVRRAFRLDLEGALREAGVTNGVVFVREPTSVRILHRLWGLGMQRDVATQLINSHDACTILAGIQVAERDTVAGREEKLRAIVRGAAPLPDGPVVLGTRDKGIKFARIENVTAACKAELDDDKDTPGVYGSALLLNQFDAEGRIAGDVIWVQDLSEHNEVLRARFGDRKWYRFVVTEERDLRLTTKVVPY
jgi:hypothetical protein